MKSARTPEKLCHVPNQPRSTNPHRSVRFEDDEWSDGDQATGEMGTSRGRVLNELYRWYLRRPGAKLPERPSPELMAKIVRDRLARKAAEAQSAEDDQPSD